MSFARNKDDFIFSSRYNQQEVTYFDDSFFIGEEPSEMFKDKLNFKTSEITQYIDEFSKFIPRKLYISEGFLRFSYKKEQLEKEAVPIFNIDELKSLKIDTSYTKTETVDEQKMKDINISIIVDLTYSSEYIVDDILKLSKKYDYFNLRDIIKMIGISDESAMVNYFSSEKLFMLESRVVTFMVIEYCLMRKNLFMSKNNALSCIEKIYNYKG